MTAQFKILAHDAVKVNNRIKSMGSLNEQRCRGIYPQLSIILTIHSIFY
jgi:hypothetical protein